MKDVLLAIKEIGANTCDGLHHFMDDEEAYCKYVMQFPEEGSMLRLEKAVAEKDYTEAEHAVHALKGIVRSLELVPLADAAIDMLEELRDGNVPDALEAYDELKTQYRRFCDVILACRKG